MYRRTLAALLLLCSSGFALAERAPYTPEQLTLIRTTSEARLSPDGTTVAFVTDISGTPELWTVPAVGGWPSQLTNLNENVTDVRWSPDGRWLVFASDHGGNERRDLYRVPAEGGPVEQLTDTTRLSEQEPRFAPDGKRLAFTADPDRESVFQLHVMDLETRKTVRLTEESLSVRSPVWSPDGRTLAVVRTGDDQGGDLLLVDVASRARVVVGPPVKGGILWPVAFAPDGASLLLRARNKAGFLQAAVLPLAPAAREARKPAGVPVFIAPEVGDVTAATWTGDGIYLLCNEGGATSLSFLPSPRDRALTLSPAEGVLSGLSLDRTGHKLALLREDTTRPADVWVADVPAALREARGADRPGPRLQLRQVTFSLMGGVKPEELARAEMASYESFDRKTIHTLLLRPKVNRLGSPPPGVVYAHGGPDLQMDLSFDPFLQSLAEAGFVVIAPNYRGSTGYGKAFQDANIKDWGGGDLKDLVAAVRHFGARGVIDPKRVGITGGSYGGYLTLMGLARTPEVWKAGVERYGVVDLVMDYLLTESSFGPWYETEMGNPRTDAALFRERSPLTYLDDLKAPLLIFQGTNDPTVPKVESDLLVSVLRSLKKPHDYVVYDDEGHGFRRRKNVLDCDRRTLQFFVKQLRQEPR